VKRHALATLTLVAGSLCAVPPISAQGVDARPRPSVATVSDSALDAQTKAVASTLRCPVCQGESIEDSPSDLARQMRAVVRDKLRAGESPDQVKAYFASKYGEWILLEPTMKGLNILLYAIPVLLVVGGLALVTFLVRRWTASESPAP
jgi:cytochrome c-type biogenesis protein CcmH